MPFYRVSEMAESRVAAQPMGRFKGLAGELMKVGFVTYPKGKMSRPHYHPNEEQFLLILEGRQWMIVGDEEQLIAPRATSSTSPGGPSTAASSSMRSSACSPPRVLRAMGGSIRITTTRRMRRPSSND